MRWLAIFCALVPCLAQSQPAPPLRFEEDYESKEWTEIEVQLPPYPKAEKLLQFRVTPSNFDFFIDQDSLSVAADGVVRFTLVAKSLSGAENVTFEGIRCSSRERRTYAFGRSDKSWSKSRNNAWTFFEGAGRILQYETLALDFFCPNGNIIKNAKTGIDALRWGPRR
jgi:hypothetical protein